MRAVLWKVDLPCLVGDGGTRNKWVELAKGLISVGYWGELNSESCPRVEGASLRGSGLPLLGFFRQRQAETHWLGLL